MEQRSLGYTRKTKAEHPATCDRGQHHMLPPRGSQQDARKKREKPAKKGTDVPEGPRGGGGRKDLRETQTPNAARGSAS